MRPAFPLLIVTALTIVGCHSEMSIKGKLVESINTQVSRIDHNHRVQILEDDFVRNDSTFKIREYKTGGKRIKVVGIVSSTHFERDDYFYFDENEQPIFSGHMVNYKDDRLAQEYKYYFDEGKIVRAYMWEDHYEPGKRFPHEVFKPFDPDLDSLMNEEKSRREYYIGLAESEGIEIKSENENLGANH